MVISTNEKWGKNAEETLQDQQIPCIRVGGSDLQDSPIWGKFLNPKKQSESRQKKGMATSKRSARQSNGGLEKKRPRTANYGLRDGENIHRSKNSRKHDISWRFGAVFSALFFHYYHKPCANGQRIPIHRCVILSFVRTAKSVGKKKTFGYTI